MIKTDTMSMRTVAVVLTVAMLAWATSMVTLTSYAFAANITSASDTLTSSNLSTAAQHTISFGVPGGVAASGTVTATFPSGFNLTGVTAGDITVQGVQAGATPSGSAWGAAISGQVVTLTNGTTAVAAAGTVTIVIGTTHKITNPGTAGSYEISFATASDSGAVRVAIIDDVVVSASVGTSLTFAIAGVAAGQTSANGETAVATTSVESTASTIPWGALTPNVAKVARQDLTVATNAKNGYSVTVYQNQPLTSSTGATISNFKDGSIVTTPEAWASPANTLGTPATYGHMALTTSDDVLTGASGDTKFGTAKYAGIGSSSSPTEVMYHNAPADGSTAGVGAVSVGYKIQVSALQAAGNDYTNTLVYVATPVF